MEAIDNAVEHGQFSPVKVLKKQIVDLKITVFLNMMLVILVNMQPSFTVSKLDWLVKIGYSMMWFCKYAFYFI